MLFAIGFGFIAALLLFSGIDAAFTVSSAAATPPFRSVVIRPIGSCRSSLVEVPLARAATRQPHHLFKRGSGSEKHTAWYKHVVKQGVTLALPVAIMLSVVTTAPIMVINPQPVQAAAVATKEDIIMLTNEIQSMFDAQDKMFDALGTKIDERGKIIAALPIQIAAINVFGNGVLILFVNQDMARGAAERAKSAAAREAQKAADEKATKGVRTLGIIAAAILAYILVAH